ncbi:MULTISPECIES: DUF1294 domain-containing protein [unclassified Pseudomonas]|uniref:DUF1294 domain-containing protein n=1 Tax=unclassified Pseudomonas TaxID=196821 RepID=UPI002AC9C83C|nr:MULTISPECIES: DUF1294 domain-containing protein [unclassified Pseudomonas]MEB0040630.1 DUF1294 domain-containing protein [Pseudomonas sp. MH10]MEB0076177.1 DUF1294 domain-containing protein [Pseudomonas sp. MH10out]MEB0090672.1 DUF1294 domain-containing protein [Pseudomonas sp. CCI4.2]MEB0100650.1 DUF1294 domain-containing protein [Pseudomonas sp. CCI3.2]MEB0123141.1 DUF1294 domain-containing protein [Pseudomonas sp. CCI1.2]
MDQRAQSRSVKRPTQYLRVKLFILLGLSALPVFGALSMLIGRVSAIPACLYGVMSVLTFFLYWRDKSQARNEGWRTPEKVLHVVELLGGWPGGLVAQQILRHKTRKVSYQVVFWLIVVAHELFWLDRLLLGGRFLARHLY